ncbi:MAG: hypothetical protein Q7K43_02735, partial [Candidatus Woesearchaeota archaeon]|nr:hypothetical protein [Candidatus Woesearchaeota archaeon]
MTGLDHILRSERWTSNLNIVHPILQNDIDRFSKWVMYAGFRTFHHYTEKEVAKWKLGQDHYGHDFISYLDEEQVEHFGLPSNTSVRAIKDGVVIAIIKNDGRFA